jgi:hypothetical protein
MKRAFVNRYPATRNRHDAAAPAGGPLTLEICREPGAFNFERHHARARRAGVTYFFLKLAEACRSPPCVEAMD